MKKEAGAQEKERLRQKAIDRLGNSMKGGREASSGDFEKMFHEIEIHQVELEMQNDELRRTQVELEDAQQRYFDCFEFAPVGYLTMDREGRITDINLSGAALLGGSKTALLGRGFLGLVKPEDQATFHAHLRETVATDQKCVCTLSISPSDRADLIVNLQSTARVAGEGEEPGIMTTMTDVTALTRAEEEVLSKQHFIEHITETIPSIVYIYDLQEEATVYANARLNALLGYDLGELAAMGPRPYEKIIHAEDVPGWRTYLDRCRFLREGEARGIDIRIRHADGSWRWFHSRNMAFSRDEKGEVRKLLGVADDITSSRETREALVASEERYELLVESMNDGLVLHDEKGRIRFVNEKLRRTLGYTAEEMHGQLLTAFAEDPNNVSEAMSSLLPQIGAGRKDFEEPLRRRDGRLMRFRISHQPLFDSRDRFKGSFSVLTDITELRYLRQKVELSKGFEGLIGRDEQMLELFESIRLAAATDFPVLIYGGSGTGKELVAQALHNLSPRAGGNFVPLNCGAIPETLFESELFGHVKGSFTGAHRDKKGHFERAHGGTIFLDEVAELSTAMQVKLLRTLQDGTYERVGDEKSRQSNVRVICATNKDLGREIAAGRFRKDLYYRLSAVPLSIPALRERRADVPILAKHIIRQLALESGRSEMEISPNAMKALTEYDWPGNVRELQNALQYACFKSRWHAIEVYHLPPAMQGQDHHEKDSGTKRRRKVDAGAIASALRDCRGNKTEAAGKLGISRATLYRIMRVKDKKNPKRPGAAP